MRLIIFLCLIPGFLTAQKVNDNWTTPVADIEFGDTKITYSFFSEAGVSTERIMPYKYNISLLDIHEVNNIYGVYIDDYKKLTGQLINYVSDRQIGKAGNRYKHTFLETCALLIIWNIDKNEFDKTGILETLNLLKNDLSIEISVNANMVLNLYDFYYVN